MFQVPHRDILSPPALSYCPLGKEVAVQPPLQGVRSYALSPRGGEDLPKLYEILLCKRFVFSFIFFKDFIYLFLERGREGERGRETSMCGHLSCSPYWGPGLQPRHVCALTGNRTGVPLVCRLALNPLSDTSQGILLLFIYSIICINMDSWIFILKFELKI